MLNPTENVARRNRIRQRSQRSAVIDSREEINSASWPTAPAASAGPLIGPSSGLSVAR
jgi:hypothetical protein